MALTLVMQAISVGILVYCFALFAVPWIDAFSAPRGDVMMAIAIMQVATGLCSPFAGRIMETTRMRQLVIFGALLVGSGLMLASITTALWQIILIYALILPVGSVFCGTLCAQTMVTRWFTDNRGMAIGVSAMGTSLGGFVFPYVANWLIGGLGWREAVLQLGLFAIVTITPLALLILRREPPPRPAANPQSQNAHAASDNAPVAPQSSTALTRWTTRNILRSRMFWLPIAAFIPLNAGFGAVQFNLAAYTRDLGFAAGTAAMLISVTSLAMMAGKLMFGALGDKVDHRILYWIAAASLGSALLALQFNPQLPRVILGVVFLGVATGAVIPLMAVIFASRFGDQSFSRVMGLAQMFFMLGAIGPWIAGLIYDLTNSYDPAFMALFVLILPVALGMIWLPKPATT